MAPPTARRCSRQLRAGVCPRCARSSLHRTWLRSPREGSGDLIAAVRTWQSAAVDAVVRDRAGGHRTRAVRDVGLPLIEQPAGSPELNPAERIFEELRRLIEGCLYETIEQKMAAVDQALSVLAADPARVRRLAGWPCIMASWQALQTAGL